MLRVHQKIQSKWITHILPGVTKTAAAPYGAVYLHREGHSACVIKPKGELQKVLPRSPGGETHTHSACFFFFYKFSPPFNQFTYLYLAEGPKRQWFSPLASLYPPPGQPGFRPDDHSPPHQGGVFRPSASAAEKCSIVSDSVWPYGLHTPRLLCPQDSPGKNTGVGGCFLLQGDLPNPRIISGFLASGTHQSLVNLAPHNRPGQQAWVLALFQGAAAWRRGLWGRMHSPAPSLN